jgi:hydroxyacylglutathione hydrolase
MFLRRLRMIDLVKLPLRQTESEFSAVEPEALQSASNTAIVDVRGWLKFGEGHFPGSWNICLESADFAANARIFVQRKSRILLVSEDYWQADRARLKLLRAGFRHIEGFIEAHKLTAFHRITQLAAVDLRSTLSRGGKPALLDVRSSKEYWSTSIPESTNIPLEILPVRFSELSTSRPLVVICQDGYRSAVASSWLQSKGFESVHHLIGGMNAYGDVSLTEFLPALSLSAA